MAKAKSAWPITKFAHGGHMALFMMKQRIIYRDDAPLLSCRDIGEMLKRFLPKKSVSEQEVMERIKARHRRRAKVSESKARRQAEMMVIKRGRTNVSK